MTYRDLIYSLPITNLIQSISKEALAASGVSEDWLNDDVTVRVGDDEFVPVKSVGYCKKGDPADGILDRGHIYLEANDE